MSALTTQGGFVWQYRGCKIQLNYEGYVGPWRYLFWLLVQCIRLKNNSTYAHTNLGKINEVHSPKGIYNGFIVFRILVYECSWFGRCERLLLLSLRLCHFRVRCFSHRSWSEITHAVTSHGERRLVSGLKVWKKTWTLNLRWPSIRAVLSRPRLQMLL